MNQMQLRITQGAIIFFVGYFIRHGETIKKGWYCVIVANHLNVKLGNTEQYFCKAKLKNVLNTQTCRGFRQEQQ